MKTVYMVQLTLHRWQLESYNGSVMQPDITVHSVHDATEYVKNYISSFQGWNYVIVPLDNKIQK